MNYVWKTLSDTGTHEHMEYVENERHEIREQFDHVPQRVLDVGCAGGGVGFGLKRDYNAFVWGVELNKIAAAHAATRLDKVSTIPLEQFTNEDIALLKTIDTVCLLDVLEHMYHPWSALSFLEKHLPPHAQVIVSLPNMSNANVVRDLTSGFWHYKPHGLLDITHIRFFTPYEMDKMLCETGYAIQSVNYHGTNSYEHFATLSEHSEFPTWQNFGDIQIKVRSYEHWLHLHTIQVTFRAQVTPDHLLTLEQRAKRFELHPPTHTF